MDKFSLQYHKALRLRKSDKDHVKLILEEYIKHKIHDEPIVAALQDYRYRLACR